MNSPIYLDNNATTSIDTEVMEEMLPYLKEEFGNPSSIYKIGKRNKQAIEKARTKVANLIHAKPSEIIFTSCASESNTTAIMSAVRNSLGKKHIITTKVEHTSILETMKFLEKEYEVTYLSVNDEGEIDLKELQSEIREDTFLISIMFANNETGNIYPIKEIGEIAHQKSILLHVDATQAIGKIEIDVKKEQIDMLSFSGHKIHAPKGIGVLYVKENIAFTPLIFGHQEKGRRGGTENVPYIVGIGKAAEILLEERNRNEDILALRCYMEEQIKQKIEGVVIYGEKAERLNNTINVAFTNVLGEELLLLLERERIYVGTGSACNSDSIEKSYVLEAMGVKDDKSSPIRISISKETTKQEIDYVVERLQVIVENIRKLKE